MRKVRLASAVLLACCVALGAPALAASDFILEIPGVAGESVYPDHEDEIDILAWSWGASNSGCGGGGSSLNVQNVSLTKWVDQSSVNLLSAIQDNTVFMTITLRHFNAVGNEVETLAFENAYITSISTGGSAGDDRLTENVTIGFSQATITYQLFDGIGKALVTESTTITVGACP